jgi:predicted thioredoxin/glutaredoxin
MLAQLAALPNAGSIVVDVVDVDLDPVTRTRFGHKIPVLLLDGQLICHGHLDAEEVRKALQTGA